MSEAYNVADGSLKSMDDSSLAHRSGMHRIVPGGNRSLPPLCCMLLLIALLILAPSQLMPTDPSMREMADRAAPSPSELALWLRSSVVTRWGGLLHAEAGGSCPY